MSNVIALKGSRITMTNNTSTILIDYNELSKKVVRVQSPYANHQTMVGKDVGDRFTTLLQAGWTETERRTWHGLYM